MKIEETQCSDFDSVVELVKHVSIASILPNFNKQGQATFSSKILPDVEKTFNIERFQSLKITLDNEVIGFGAIRDRDYITHLFVSIGHQGSGVGKLILKNLLSLSNAREVRLWASVNAVKFYKSQNFIATGVEMEVGVIRYVPTIWQRD